MDISPVVVLKLAGWLQILLSVASLAIPRLLNWKKELMPVTPIIRQMFWTYAGYILVINFSFGLVSVFGAAELIAGTFLAKCISVFIFLYWLARIFIQFFYFDTRSAPQGWIYKDGEVGLNCLFVFLTLVYGWIAYLNLFT
jgi:hypothetical protein